jgi:hypothetical protein
METSVFLCQEHNDGACCVFTPVPKYLSFFNSFFTQTIETEGVLWITVILNRELLVADCAVAGCSWGRGTWEAGRRTQGWISPTGSWIPPLLTSTFLGSYLLYTTVAC